MSTIDPITALDGAEPPSRARPDTFADEGDEYLGRFPLLTTQINTTAGQIEAVGEEATNSASSAAAAATQAQGYAAQAILAPGTSATSTDSLTPGSGMITFNVQTGKQFVAGQFATATDPTNRSRKFYGSIDSYVSGTGVLVLNCSKFYGVGVGTSWIIGLSGAPGVDAGATTASINPTLNTNVVLSAASAGVQSFTPQKAGLSVTLPNATTLQVDVHRFLLQNRSPVFDMLVFGFNGDLKGFLAPESSAIVAVVDTSSAAGIFDLQSLQPIGTEALSDAITIGAAIGGSAGVFVQALVIDANRTLILFHGRGLYAIVYDSSTQTYGTPATVRTAISTNGAVGNVLALALPTAGNFLITSINEGSTALQAVVLTISGSVVTVNTAAAGTLAATATRLFSLIAVGTSYVLGYMAGATVARIRAMTVSGTTVTIGAAEQSNTTVSDLAAMLAITATTFLVLTASAAALTAKGFSVATTVITAGTAASVTATNTTNLSVRTNMTGTGIYLTEIWVSYQNSGAYIARVNLSSTTAVWSTPVAISTITNVAAGGIASTVLNNGIISAVTGTDGGGNFVTEFSYVNYSAALVGSILKKVHSALASVVSLATSGANWAGGSECVFVVRSSAEESHYRFTAPTVGSWSLLHETRRGNLAGFAEPFAGQDVRMLQEEIPRTTMLGSGITDTQGRAYAFGDGSKPSTISNLRALSSTMRPVPTIAPMSNSGKVDYKNDEAWVAYSRAPSTTIQLQKVRVV